MPLLRRGQSGCGRWSEAGYTLIEVVFVVSMIAIMAFAGIAYSRKDPAAINTSISQFSAMLEATYALAAATNGVLGAANGTQAFAATGATLWVAPDPNDTNFTVATLYKYRPISKNPLSGRVQIDPLTAPLRMRIGLTIIIASQGGESIESSSFAIFVGSSGHAAPVLEGTWDPSQPPLLSEPACDPQNEPVLTFSAGGNQQTLHLACYGAVMVQ